ncbi:hypothetical protein LP7551_04908 [Roseibium album]|nr:hypothetical protein LP7551_04908 [Roseibium album]
MLKPFKEFDPRVGERISELCDEFVLADDAFGHGLPRIAGYPKFPRDTRYRTSAFKEALSKLSEGTYIFIDHPAVGSEELEATSHEGYEDVAADRMTCFETLTSAVLKERIDQLGIELISYREL